MELSILHIFVDHTNYKGILRFCITREFHNLCIEMRLHQITLQAKDTIDVFRKNLESDPNNPNLIDIIPTKQVLKEIYYLTNSENIIDYIKSIPESNVVNKYNIEFSQNFTCVLEKNQLRRVFNFFNSFVSNFALLDSVFKLYINMIEVSKPQETSVEIPKQKEQVQKTLKPVENTLKLETPDSINKDFEVKNPDLAPKNEIEYILESYCLNNIFKSFVINHIFNHLRYLTDSVDILKEMKEDSNNPHNYMYTIKIPILFDPFYYSLNHDYIISIFKSTFLETDENIISFNQKKILENICILLDKGQDSNNNLLLMLLLFIFYCYQYSIIISKYPDFEFENYFNPETQQAGINFFINKYEPTKPFMVIILESVEEENDDKLVDNISEKFKHLIPVSETDFLDIVVSEYKKPRDFKIKDFQLSTSKIIDVDLLMVSNTVLNRIKNEKSTTVKTDNYSVRSCTSSLLNFEETNITKAYHHFKEYVINPTTLSSLLSLKELPVPKQVLNLFDFFSRNLQKLFNDSKENNTLNYYQILVNNLPSPKSYGHYTYLYLIYNLIIPYHVDHFKTTKFIDSFL